MRLNLDGVFLGPRMALEVMRSTADRPRKSSGSIINISSVLGQVGLADTAPYCASKAGVCLLTKAAALESASNAWPYRRVQRRRRCNPPSPRYIRFAARAKRGKSLQPYCISLRTTPPL